MRGNSSADFLIYFRSVMGTCPVGDAFGNIPVQPSGERCRFVDMLKLA